jgi:hypothetical protein
LKGLSTSSLIPIGQVVSEEKVKMSKVNKWRTQSDDNSSPDIRVGAQN